MSVLGYDTSSVIGFVILFLLASLGLLSLAGGGGGGVGNILSDSQSSASLDADSNIVEDIEIVNEGLRIQLGDIDVNHENARNSQIETTISVETVEVVESPNNERFGLSDGAQQISVAETEISFADGSTSVSEDHGQSISNSYEYGSPIVDSTRDGRVSVLLSFSVEISDSNNIEQINNREISKFVSFEADSLDISNVEVSGSLNGSATAPP